MSEKRWGIFFLILVLVLYGALALGGSARKSVTVDELGHLPSGLLYLETGDARFASLNPPLVNLISAMPVWGAVPEHTLVKFEASEDPFSFWENGYRFMEENQSSYRALIERARIAPIALVALMGILVFYWTRRLVADSDRIAGLLAAGLVLLSPNVIAQARLVGTDTGTAFFIVLAFLAFRRFLERPQWGSVLLAGFALGAAQLTKFYALLLYPTFFFVVAFWGWASREAEAIASSKRRAQWWGLLAIGVTSLLVLNVGYLGMEWGQSLSGLSLQSSLMKDWASGALGNIPLPLPAAYIRAFDGQWVEVGSSMPSVLWGERFQGGRWDYFLGLLMMKTPIPVMIVFVIAILGLLKKAPLPKRESMFLLSYPLLLIVFLSWGDRRQIGLRALMSATPLMAVWMSAMLAHTLPRRWLIPSVSILVIGLGVISTWAYPDHLAYFNTWVGGSQNGYRYVSDANLDIGQDLIALSEYLREANEDRVQLLYYGSVDPGLYGIDYVVPDPANLDPGLLAVSVSLYHHRYPTYDHGQLRMVGPVRIPIEPIASIGGSIHLFRLGRLEENTLQGEHPNP